MEANLCYYPPFRLGLFDLSLSMSFSFFSSFSSFFPIIINIINIRLPPTIGDNTPTIGATKAPSSPQKPSESFPL